MTDAKSPDRGELVLYAAGDGAARFFQGFASAS